MTTRAPRFGDYETQRAHDERCHAAIRKQTTEYMVLPDEEVSTRRGVVRGPAAIAVADLEGAHPDRAMKELVRLGIVNRRSPAEVKARQPPSGGTHRYVGRQGITSRRGVLSPGAHVSAADWPEPSTFEHLQRRGLVVPLQQDDEPDPPEAA